MDNANQDPAQSPRREPEKGKFFAVNFSYSGYVHDVTLINEDDLVWDDELVMFPPGRRPERPYPTIPRLGFKKDSKKRKLPEDFGGVVGFWLISERLKQVFERVDPQGFVFVPCEFIFPDGRQGPQYYLCDVIRIVDALDEKASKLKIIISEEYAKGKHYSFLGLPKIAFKEDRLKGVHVFKTPYNTNQVFCDRVLRDAILAVGESKEDRIRGLSLDDAANL